MLDFPDRLSPRVFAILSCYSCRRSPWPKAPISRHWHHSGTTT